MVRVYSFGIVGRVLGGLQFRCWCTSCFGDTVCELLKARVHFAGLTIGVLGRMQSGVLAQVLL